MTQNLPFNHLPMTVARKKLEVGYLPYQSG